MDKFYVIKIIDKKGDVGFIHETQQGLVVRMGNPTSAMVQYKSFDAARGFLRISGIEKSGIRAYILDNSDLIEYIKRSGNAMMVGMKMWYVENRDGEKLFYSEKEQGYYFHKSDIGFCCWKTEIDARTAIKAYDLKDAVAKPIGGKT